MSNWFVGFTMGIITVIAFNRLTDQEPKIVTQITSSDVINAFKQGRKEALALNPVSMELEEACLSLWSTKQVKE